MPVIKPELAVAVVSVVLAILIVLDWNRPNFRKRSEVHFSHQPTMYRAVVVGGTGATGRQLVHLLDASPKW